MATNKRHFLSRQKSTCGARESLQTLTVITLCFNPGENTKHYIKALHCCYVYNVEPHRSKHGATEAGWIGWLIFLYIFNLTTLVPAWLEVQYSTTSHVRHCVPVMTPGLTVLSGADPPQRSSGSASVSLSPSAE
jgi:hypothetical protein